MSFKVVVMGEAANRVGSPDGSPKATSDVNLLLHVVGNTVVEAQE